MPPLLDTENDIVYVDDIDKCNLLNSFFCSISNLDDNNCNPPNLELRTNSKLAIIEFTIKEISDIVKPLNIRDRRPFNLKGGLLWFLFRSEFFFRTTQELEYFFFVSQSAQFFSRIPH